MFRNYVSAAGAVNVAQAQTLLVSPPEDVDRLMAFWWGNGVPGQAYNVNGRPHLLWDHLIYAFMVENTRAYEIVHRVLWELLHGERLGLPQNPGTFQWLRTTEELFYKDASPWQPWSQVSRVRSDIRAGRRNAYFRMFGMDLNHGGENGPYPYVRPDVANREFVRTFEELLRQVWVGVVNATNVAGPQPTDDATIADLAQRLQDMLTTRRGAPTGAVLAREEFDYVATMSWIHLTVLFATQVLQDLQVTSTSAAERLRLLGERVGVPAHAHTHDQLALAPLMSHLLRLIEAGTYSTVANVPALYLPLVGGTPNPVRQMMASIINHWDRVTGRRLRASVNVGAGASPLGAGAVGAVPLVAPAPMAPPVAASSFPGPAVGVPVVAMPTASVPAASTNGATQYASS